MNIRSATCVILSLFLCGCGDAPPVAGRVCDDDHRNCERMFIDKATGEWAPCAMAHKELERTACASVGYVEGS